MRKTNQLLGWEREREREREKDELKYAQGRRSQGIGHPPLRHVGAIPGACALSTPQVEGLLEAAEVVDDWSTLRMHEVASIGRPVTRAFLPRRLHN